MCGEPADGRVLPLALRAVQKGGGLCMHASEQVGVPRYPPGTPRYPPGTSLGPVPRIF